MSKVNPYPKGKYCTGCPFLTYGTYLCLFLKKKTLIIENGHAVKDEFCPVDENGLFNPDIPCA